MKLPDKIKILGRVYELVPSPGLDAREGNAGHIWHVLGRIEYDPDFSPVHTVIHEIVHNLRWQLGLAVSDETAEEAAVNQITSCVLAVLADNPGLIRAIAEAQP